ncbi:MAG: adenylyltransferase, partial [Clostridia bacterium]|nr:adenylyltransferase [Clostridia bacterium]
IGVIPGLLGSIQATEVIKYLTGVGSLLTNTLLVVHADDMEFARLELPEKDETCPVCGRTPTITTLRMEEEEACEVKDR